ncbi:HAD family hydrolase [Slackia exigua]
MLDDQDNAVIDQVARVAIEHPGQHLIAAFDFDGTAIQGNSPVLLVRYLQKRGMLGKRVIGKILAWAAAYKLRLPQNEAWVRGLVFTAFEGRAREEVDAFLRDFYDEVIEGQKRFRPQAAGVMEELRAIGAEVVIVSATFDPIVQRAREERGFDACICTRMEVDRRGLYTTRVDGPCIEGIHKVRSLRAYAPARYGEGKWRLAAAFGDHHSDISLLAAADNAFAVSPDNPLEREAKRRGWNVLDWTCPVEK